MSEMVVLKKEPIEGATRRLKTRSERGRSLWCKNMETMRSRRRAESAVQGPPGKPAAFGFASKNGLRSPHATAGCTAPLLDRHLTVL